MSMKERAVSCKTLTCLLQAIVGKDTTVELRNETSVVGRISHVDGFMNTEITDAILTTPSGAKHRFSNFFVQGKQIRFVQIPDNVDMIEAIEKRLLIIRKPQTHCERARPVKVIKNTERIRKELYQ